MSEPEVPKARCSRQPCKNYAVEEGLCRMHHPRFEDARRAAGKMRHPRFGKVLSGPDMPPLDRTKVPTIAGIIDQGFDIADAVRTGRLEPSQAHAMVAALKLSRDGLEAEREREDRLKFAWERDGQGTRSTESASAEGASSKPDDGDGAGTPAAPLPPWMTPQ